MMTMMTTTMDPESQENVFPLKSVASIQLASSSKVEMEAEAV